MSDLKIGLRWIVDCLRLTFTWSRKSNELSDWDMSQRVNYMRPFMFMVSIISLILAAVVFPANFITDDIRCGKVPVDSEPFTRKNVEKVCSNYYDLSWIFTVENFISEANQIADSSPFKNTTIMLSIVLTTFAAVFAGVPMFLNAYICFFYKELMEKMREALMEFENGRTLVHTSGLGKVIRGLMGKNLVIFALIITLDVLAIYLLMIPFTFADLIPLPQTEMLPDGRHLCKIRIKGHNREIFHIMAFCDWTRITFVLYVLLAYKIVMAGSIVIYLGAMGIKYNLLFNVNSTYNKLYFELEAKYKAIKKHCGYSPWDALIFHFVSRHLSKEHMELLFRFYAINARLEFGLDRLISIQPSLPSISEVD